MSNKWDKKLDSFERGLKKDPEDYEGAHIYQDKIYREFILAIAAGKFRTISDARAIAKDIAAVVIAEDKKATRWYS